MTSYHPKQIIHAEDITLRFNHANIKIARDMFEAIDSNREELGQWVQGIEAFKSSYDCLEYLVQSQNHSRTGEGLSYGIYDNNKYIGTIEALFNSENSANMGFWLKQDYRGNGLIQQAIAPIEKEMMQQYGAQSLEIRCSNNPACEKTAIKAGYPIKKVLREDELETKIYEKLFE